MEFVIGFIIIAMLWILRKTIRIWSHVSEKASESKAREVLVTVAKADIHTSKEVQTLINDTEVTLDLDTIDAFLMDGRRPVTTTSTARSA